MDLTHLHLILNHIPVIGIAIGFLTLAWGTLRGYEEVKTTGLAILVLTALFAIPAFLTGEPAEETVERLPGVSEQIIELHEDSALYSLILAVASGALALGALATKRFLTARISLSAIFACLVLSLITGASMAYTANLGGQVRHSEIRQTRNADAENQAQKKNDDRDRDD